MNVTIDFQASPTIMTNGNKFRLIQKCLDEDWGDELQKLIDTTLKDLPEHLFPNYGLESGMTPLGEAVWRFKYNCIKVLLNHPRIDVDKMSGQDCTVRKFSPITLAMTRQVTDQRSEAKIRHLIEYLLEHPKISINKVKEGALYPIHMAIMNLSTKYLKYFLSMPDLNLEVTTRQWDDCAGLAVQLNRMKHLRLLLSHPRFDINPVRVPVPKNKPPKVLPRRVPLFFHCIQKRKTKMVGMFLAAGINPNHSKKYEGKYVWNSYQANLMSMMTDTEEHHLEARMSIAHVLWQAGAKATIPHSMRRTIFNRMWQTGKMKTEFQRAVTYIAQDLPNEVLSCKSLLRIHYKKQAQRVVGKKSIRKHMEKSVGTSELPLTVKRFLLESEDMSARDSDTDDEIE